MVDEEKKISLEKIEAADFSRFRKYIDGLLGVYESIQNYSGAQALCFAVAAHYKHLAQLDGIRDSAKQEAQYFLQKGFEYMKKENTS